MTDHYIRAITKSGGIRILACSITGLASEICTLQQASATVCVALGRGLAAGALMGGMLKGDQRIALKFEGNGPLRKMIIEADGDGALRACCGNPSAEAEPVDGRWNVPGVLGRAGFLTVSKDHGFGGLPYQGMVQLQSSEIGDDLALYLTESEQIPSAVGVSTLLDQKGAIAICGGFLVQAIPNKANDAEISAILERISSLRPIAELLAEGGTDGLLEALLAGIEYNRLESRELFFRCGCSREKVSQALHSLGAEGINELRESDGHAEVTCEFCQQKYRFEAAELQSLELLAVTGTAATH
ncbi:MAG: Hsp33 family molecular chaperone HslO [Geobacter sp.]|nr:Hsp33 family molecular chaperone HslO [Geobacter sp.]